MQITRTCVTLLRTACNVNIQIFELCLHVNNLNVASLHKIRNCSVKFNSSG